MALPAAVAVNQSRDEKPRRSAGLVAQLSALGACAAGRLRPTVCMRHWPTKIARPGTGNTLSSSRSQTVPTWAPRPLVHRSAAWMKPPLAGRTRHPRWSRVTAGLWERRRQRWSEPGRGTLGRGQDVPGGGRAVRARGRRSRWRRRARPGYDASNDERRRVADHHPSGSR